jgi:hypothetical protein
MQKKILFPALFTCAVLSFCFLSARETPAQNTPYKPAISDALSSLDKAISAHRVGDNITALESIWAAQESIWSFSPLGVRNAAFVTEEPLDYGKYSPKEGDDFSPGELILLYCEPFGYTQRKNPDGTYSFSYSWSFKIFDSKENLLGGQDGLGPLLYEGYRSFKTENMMNATIKSNLPPGSYILQVTITDGFNPSHAVDIRKPFNIVGDPSAG